MADMRSCSTYRLFATSGEMLLKTLFKVSSKEDISSNEPRTVSEPMISARTPSDDSSWLEVERTLEDHVET